MLCEMRELREYFRPSSPEEAVAIKRQHGERAVYLGGGSDLMVLKPRGVEVAIDIRHAGMGYVRQEEDAFVIGGGALLRDVERSLGPVAGGMLVAASRDTAPWLIRNAATLAGNIANASPAADSVPALLALDAELELMNGGLSRASIPDVILGPHRTNLGDRLIVQIRIPRAVWAKRATFTKLSRSKSDIAQVNVAVSLIMEGGVASDVRIALGAVAPVPMRARQAEFLLEGRPATSELLQEVERAVQAEVRPISDWRAGERYRRRMSGVLVRRALEQLTGLEME